MFPRCADTRSPLACVRLLDSLTERNTTYISRFLRREVMTPALVLLSSSSPSSCNDDVEVPSTNILPVFLVVLQREDTGEDENEGGDTTRLSGTPAAPLRATTSRVQLLRGGAKARHWHDDDASRSAATSSSTIFVDDDDDDDDCCRWHTRILLLVTIILFSIQQIKSASLFFDPLLLQPRMQQGCCTEWLLLIDTAEPRQQRNFVRYSSRQRTKMMNLPSEGHQQQS